LVKFSPAKNELNIQEAFFFSLLQKATFIGKIISLKYFKSV